MSETEQWIFEREEFMDIQAMRQRLTEFSKEDLITELLGALIELAKAAQTSKCRETGVLKQCGDWPGIFIRGDDALSFAYAIEHGSLGPMAELVELLKSCKAPAKTA